MTVSGAVLQSHHDDQPDRIFGGYYRAVPRACGKWRGCCYQPNCYKESCRRGYRWSKRKQIDMGITEALLEHHLLRFATFTLLDVGQKTYRQAAIQDLKTNIYAVQGKLMERIGRRGHKPMWFRVWGMKQKSSPYQLHLHLLFTCTPDCDPLRDPDLMAWLEGVANEHGLRVQVVAVTEPNGIARYMAYKNLSELDAIELPPRFQRFRASPNTPRMDYQIRDAIQRKRRELVKRFKSYLEAVKTAFPILIWEHWRKGLVRQLRRLLAQQASSPTFHALHPPTLPVVLLGRWFILRLTNLWRKVRYEIQWLSRLQGHEID